MRAARPYRSTEIDALKPIFGDAIDYGRVRLRRGPGLNPIAAIAFANRTPAITLGRTIYFAASAWREDFTVEGADFPLLAHETTHIWQYQTRLGEIAGPPSVALDSLLRGADPYDLGGLTPDTPFDALGYEQQAEVVRKFVELLLKEDGLGLAKFASVLSSVGLGTLQLQAVGPHHIIRS